MNPSDDQSWGGTGRGRAVAIATGMSWSLHHRMRSYAFSFPHVMVSSMSKAHRPLGMGLRIVVHMNAKLWADHTNHLSYPPFFQSMRLWEGEKEKFSRRMPIPHLTMRVGGTFACPRCQFLRTASRPSTRAGAAI